MPVSTLLDLSSPEEFIALWNEGYPVAIVDAAMTYPSPLWTSAATRAFGWDTAEEALEKRGGIGLLQTPRLVRRRQLRRLTHDDIAGKIFRREPFRAATMSAAFARVGNLSRLGDLPPQERVLLGQAAREHGTFLYVVWSYDTPIAWAWPGHGRSGEQPAGAYVPPVRYSLTTNAHQSIAHTALGLGHRLTFGDETYSAHEPGTTQGERGGGYTPYGPRENGWP